MSPFESSLAEESKWLANIVNQSMPSDSQSGLRVYIGPTAVDLSVLTEAQRLRDQLAHEQRILAAYRHKDHRGYQSNRGIGSF